MPKNTEHRERLTEMLTLVVSPSMRARLQKIADERTNGVYAFPVRQAIQAWLDEQAPCSEKEARKLAQTWLDTKNNAQKDEDGHA